VHVRMPQLTNGAADNGHMLDYEKLDVYQSAIEHLAFVVRCLPKIPRGHAGLVDQWRRAAMSVPLNIAEGVGKPSDADRANRYAIARGEAMECGAIIDVVRLLRLVDREELDRAKQLLVRIVQMLSRMCR
jgi:four helix bundle protein